MSAESNAGVIARAAAGARVLTVRGAGMRLISVASNLLLLVLVTPAELGLLAVVRGIAGLAGDASDLGFAWALLRRPRSPTTEEFRALGGVQLGLVMLFIAVAAFAPSIVGFGAVHQWRTPMLAVLGTMVLVPLGTGARVRLERSMDYRRIAFADISGVILLNFTLLGFALAHRFAIGVFVATGALIVYSNLLLWFWAPGPGPGFQLRSWRALAHEFAGFTLGHVGSILNTSATPLIVAALFGLPVAGIWSFATRLGNVLQLAFEGFRRSAIPAAGLIAESLDALARLAQQSLLGAARLTIPGMVLLFAALPVAGWLLPQWQSAIPVAQLFVLGMGIAGIVGASVVPVAVAVRGSRVVLAEQFTPIVVAWTLFALIATTHRGTIAIAVLPMFAAMSAAVWFSCDPRIRPQWTAALELPSIAMAISCAIVATGPMVGVHPLFGATAAVLLFFSLTLGRRGAAVAQQMPDARGVSS
jgi:O-antigen/teichoic acid export membrane protein